MKKELYDILLKSIFLLSYFPMQKLATQYLQGFTDYEVQIRYKSEQNKTKYIQTNKLSISFLVLLFEPQKYLKEHQSNG